MAGNSEIWAAFKTALKSAAFLLPIHWQGTPFVPKQGKPYLEEAFIPAETATPCLGDSLVRAEGMYQITCVYPNGLGAGDAVKMADKVVKQFKRGVSLTTGGVTVTITKSWASSPLSDAPDWIRVAVSIRYFSYITP